LADRGDLLGQVLDPRATCLALGGIALVQTLEVIVELGVSPSLRMALWHDRDNPPPSPSHDVARIAYRQHGCRRAAKSRAKLKQTV
jgi:hypothetical protein